MRMTLRIPVAFPARLRADGPSRLVGCCEQISVDVPDVIGPEAPVAFFGVDGGTPFSHDPAGAVGSNAELRLYDGRLYRKVSGSVDGIVGTPFPTNREDALSRRSAGDLRDGAAAYPLPALFEAIRWRNNSRWAVTRAAVRHNPIYEMWPAAPPNPGPRIAHHDPDLRAAPNDVPPRFAHHNAVDLSEVLRRVVDVDHREIDRCISDAASHANFLLVDGGLWRAVATPVYRVSQAYDNEFSRMFRFRAPVPVVSICERPLYCDADLSVRYFPLDDPQAVMEHCDVVLETLREKLGPTRMDRASSATSDESFAFECSAPEILAFDPDEDLLRRTSHGFGIEAHAFLSKNGEKWRDKVGVDAFDVAAQAYSEVLKSDWFTEDYGDPSPWLIDNAKTWMRTGRRTSIFFFGELDEADRLVARMAELIDQRPISVAGMGFSMGGPSVAAP